MKKIIISTLLVTTLFLGITAVNPFETGTAVMATTYTYNSTDYPTIGNGYITTGSYVKKLQKFLNATNSLCASNHIANNFNCGTVDGIFGTKTYNAICNFQLDFGLDVDGICGPQTWKQLIELRNYLS